MGEKTTVIVNPYINYFFVLEHNSVMMYTIQVNVYVVALSDIYMFNLISF